MHNNGTNRLWQPSRMPIVRPNQPQEHWDVSIQHNGIHINTTIDGQPVSAAKVLSPEQANQIGLTLLQASAIFGFIKSQQAGPAAVDASDVRPT